MASNCAADKDFILKDLHPFGRGLVGRNDDRSLLMKIVHQAFHGYEQRPHLLKLGFGDAGTVVEVEVTHPAQQIILLAGVQLVLQEVVLDKANGTLDTSFTLGISGHAEHRFKAGGCHI